jgi:hypothetical protein
MHSKKLGFEQLEPRQMLTVLSVIGSDFVVQGVLPAADEQPVQIEVAAQDDEPTIDELAMAAIVLDLAANDLSADGDDTPLFGGPGQDDPPPIELQSPRNLVAPNADPAAVTTRQPPLIASYAGGRTFVRPTWQLSAIVVAPNVSSQPDSTGVRIDVASRPSLHVHAAMLKNGQWLVGEAGPRQVRVRFGADGAIPITGDFDGNGTSEIGVFLGGQWFVDLNGNGVWDENDFWAVLGEEGDLPVVGDWDGDGKDNIGIFRPAADRAADADSSDSGSAGSTNKTPGDGAQANHPLTAERGHSAEHTNTQGEVIQFGRPGDRPVTGDWNGDGRSTIGVFRDGRWHLDRNGDGRWDADDIVLRFGGAGDVPIVGDWNADGIDDVGVYHDGEFYLDVDGNRELDAADRVFRTGGAGDAPIVGDFDGDGLDEVGLYRAGPVERTARSD